MDYLNLSGLVKLLCSDSHACEICGKPGKTISLVKILTAALCVEHRRKFDLFVLSSDIYEAYCLIYEVYARAMADNGVPPEQVKHLSAEFWARKREVMHLLNAWLKERKGESEGGNEE